MHPGSEASSSPISASALQPLVFSRKGRQTWLFCGLLLLGGLLFLLGGCSLPQVKAEDRLFLNLSIDFLGEYTLPKQEFEGTQVGGLSGITYDRQQDQFYAISDDRSEYAPARFYTLKLKVENSVSGDREQPSSEINLQSVELEQVTTLYGEDGNPYPQGSVDLEGIALSPRQTVFISSEGDTNQGIAPFIAEFDLTGQWQSQLPVPDRFLPQEKDGVAIGVQNNRGFEALTINANGSAGGLEPFRLFAAAEAALQQDLSPDASAQPPDAAPIPVRILHYLIGSPQVTLLSEHLYPLEPLPEGATDGGLSELLTLDQAGHFLSLERSFGLLTGFNIKLFQVAMGTATDTSRIPALTGDATGITPVYKRLLLDLSELEIPLDNLEGMILGPQLPDGTQSLLLVSDDNFNDLQRTQFLLFRLKGL